MSQSIVGRFQMTVVPFKVYAEGSTDHFLAVIDTATGRCWYLPPVGSPTDMKSWQEMPRLDHARPASPP